MRTFFFIFCCMVSAANAHAVCDSRIPASTPDSQFTDNGDGTITDNKTDLIWKKCPEGLSGDDCATGHADTFTWEEALRWPESVNARSGFAGHTDWRLPNIRELLSLVEEHCYSPAINENMFPSTPSGLVWSRSPYAVVSGYAWYVYFNDGSADYGPGDDYYGVRLVREGR